MAMWYLHTPPPPTLNPTSLHPLDALGHSTAKVVQKIDAGEFIDFADLLQDQLPQDDLNIPASHSGVILVQSLKSLKKKKKRITDFQSWAEAFMVYVATKYRSSCPEVHC